MVSDKPSNQSARQVDIPPTTRNLVFLTHRHAGVRSAQWTGVRSCSRATDVCPAQLVCVRSYSHLWWPCSTTRNERQTVASEQPIGVPSVWVRFTLQGLKFDSESSISRGDWDCLILLPHRVTRAILWWVILRYAVKRLYLAWVVIGAYVEWLKKLETESYNMKLSIYSLLLFSWN
jgi:hypothetical protein